MASDKADSLRRTMSSRVAACAVRRSNVRPFPHGPTPSPDAFRLRQVLRFDPSLLGNGHLCPECIDFRALGIGTSDSNRNLGTGPALHRIGKIGVVETSREGQGEDHACEVQRGPGRAILRREDAPATRQTHGQTDRNRPRQTARNSALKGEGAERSGEDEPRREERGAWTWCVELDWRTKVSTSLRRLT